MSYNNTINFLQHPDDQISDSETERENGGDLKKHTLMGLIFAWTNVRNFREFCSNDAHSVPKPFNK